VNSDYSKDVNETETSGLILGPRLRPSWARLRQWYTVEM